MSPFGWTRQAVSRVDHDSPKRAELPLGSPGRFIRACHSAGFEPQIAFHNDDYTAILGFVSAGVGVAAVPEMVARSALRTVHIATLGPGGLTRPIVAALPAGYRPRPAAAMIEILQQVSERWRSAAGELVAA